ncbi:MAG: nucleotidyltransferase [Ruminococcus sp.]
MKTTGVIAEYNPFHNGHAYHILTSKKRTRSDYAVVVMSGDFVQRGAPALIDKYTRTRMALESGADLVLELPVRYALGSAEFFASGGVSLLDVLGVVDFLSFGSEEGEISPLSDIASILYREPENFQEILRHEVSRGLSFPAARQQALLSCFPDKSEAFGKILSSPNNILGIEYLKALLRFGSSITPCTLKRKESQYHQEELTKTCSSASALRRHVKDEKINVLPSQMPQPSWNLLNDAYKKREIAWTDDYSLLLKYKLMTETSDSLTHYQDISADLANRIIDRQNHLNTFESFISLLKTRQMTHSRIARALFHLLLNIPAFSLSADSRRVTPYARILGFKKEAVPLLHEIKKKSSVPLISKTAGAQSVLSLEAASMLKEDIWCSNLYESVMAIKNQRPFRHEASRPLVIY